MVACLAIVDPMEGQRWLVDCTPDFREQLNDLDRACPSNETPGLDGIVLTHAHVGHYAGLIHLGREVMAADQVPVFAMPRMRAFLESNAPWEQLVRLNQIKIEPLRDEQPLRLNDRLAVTPFLVPHRNEYSETVGFRIQGPSRNVVYLPDIDGWDCWTTKIETVVARCDIAYLDGTFYSEREVPGRDTSEIPHPLVVDSIHRLSALRASDRAKVRFIHVNHTNPLLASQSPAAKTVESAGYHVAKHGERFTI